MKIWKETGAVPIKAWVENVSSDIDKLALEQATNLSKLPFVYKHVALMPDVHGGMGVPIGGVLATRDVVIPNAVGVDIGCGMLGIRTNLTSIDLQTLKALVNDTKHKIPTGFSKRKSPVVEIPEKLMLEMANSEIMSNHIENAEMQLGTLGGGNHFLEIQEGSDGFIWIMIHSGSRNLGHTVAQAHDKIAVKLNKNWHSAVDSELKLAFLPTNTTEAKNYVSDMITCKVYAKLNRKTMGDLVMDSLKAYFPEVEVTASHDVTHNYVAVEEHFGEYVLVHRKGAVKAESGTPVIIPGSQGTKSYFGFGKGNPESFNSCSHGAGRLMSRTQAKKNLDFAAQKEMLDSQGIVHGMTSTKALDEAPGAYKSIDVVMANQTDLVMPTVELQPLAVIKG